MKKSKVLERLSRRDAFSQARQSYLQKFANLQVTTDVEVSFESLQNPASCQPKEDTFLIKIDDQTFGERVAASQRQVAPEALLPGALKGVDKGYVDAFLQEGLLFHELGHVLFSDFEALSDIQSEIVMSDRQRFHSLVNVFEDSVIEIFLRQKFDCGTQLLIKNQIYYELYHKGSRQFENPRSAEPLTQATLVARELGQVNTGLLDEWDSQPQELAIEAFYDVIQIPDARERYERLLELFNELDALTQSRHNEQQEMDEMEQGDADNSGRSDGQQAEAPQIELSPDGEDEEESEEDEDSEEEGGSGVSSPEDEESEEDEEGSGGSSQGDSEEQEEGDSEDEGGSGGDGEDDEQVEDEDTSDPLPSVGSVDDLDEEEVEDLKGDTDPDPSNSSDDERADQVESELKTAGVGEGRIVNPDPDRVQTDEEILRRASRRSRHLTRVVEDVFTPRQGDAEKRGQTHGRFDSSRIISAARGSPRCFKTEDKPDEPDFQVVVALDASGSMAGGAMSPAAEAAASVTKAFEDAGGQVYTYRFASDVTICKTPSSTYEESKELIADLNTGPATSLLPVLEKYEELSEGVRNSFLLVITDGQPAHKDRCKEELDGIEDPTASLQIGDTGRGFENNYDAFQQIDEDPEEIRDATVSLVRRLVEQGGSSL